MQEVGVNEISLFVLQKPVLTNDLDPFLELRKAKLFKTSDQYQFWLENQFGKLDTNLTIDLSLLNLNTAQHN